MKDNLLAKLSAILSECPGIYGRDQFLNSAVLVPFIQLGNEHHLLFQKRAAGISQGSEICFPGGRFDTSLDQTFRDTALRETVEELGIEEQRISIMGQLDTLITPRGVIVEPFVGRLELESIQELSPDVREVEEVFTVPLSWFRCTPPEVYYNRIEVLSSYTGEDGEEHVLLPVEELGLPSFYKGKSRAWNYRVLVFRTDEYVIWGLTAAIVAGLLEKIAMLDSL